MQVGRGRLAGLHAIQQLALTSPPIRISLKERHASKRTRHTGAQRAGQRRQVKDVAKVDRAAASLGTVSVSQPSVLVAMRHPQSDRGVPSSCSLPVLAFGGGSGTSATVPRPLRRFGWSAGRARRPRRRSASARQPRACPGCVPHGLPRLAE